MFYSDDALALLRERFDAEGIKYKLGECNENIINLIVSASNIELNVWYDVVKQVYGFNMIQGGCKTYEDINEFIKFFKTYIDIYSSFIPHAKAIADVFESVIGSNTVYDNFTGSRNSGYTAVFKILGASNKVVNIVKVGSNLFSAKLLEYTDDHQKAKVSIEYSYTFDEVNNVVLVHNIYSYMNELTKLYGSSNDISINRVAIDEFIVSIQDIKVKFKVIFDDGISYIVSEINDFEFNESVVIDKPFDLNLLYFECKRIFDDSGVANTTEEPSIYQQEEPNDLPKESDEECDFPEESEEFTEECDLTEVLNKDNLPEETVEDNLPEETVEDNLPEETTEDNLPEETLSTESSLNFYKVESDSGVSFIQVVLNNELYSLSLDVLNNLGIPLSRIHNTTTVLKNRPIDMTELELSMKQLSKEADENICNMILEALFS